MLTSAAEILIEDIKKNVIFILKTTLFVFYKY
jgi:hypothetical protein